MTSGAWIFQAPLQVLAYQFDEIGMLLQEIGDALQGGVEVDPQMLQLEIDEAELRDEEAAHFFFSARNRSRLISQMRSKQALSLW